MRYRELYDIQCIEENDDDGEILVTLQEVETRAKEDFCIETDEMCQASRSSLRTYSLGNNIPFGRAKTQKQRIFARFRKI